MPVLAQPSADGSARTITVVGRFDFGLYRDFRATYRDIPKNQCRYVVDLKSADYMDSSALGMLLLLREHAGEEAGRIRIANCRPDISRILAIAAFDRLFDIA